MDGNSQLVRFPVGDLLVVQQFGRPIFPALTPVDAVANGPADAPWHTLIEADNYHALQLLDYLYAGKVDCIYIDPPYNTGARDWKYNNDYVDENDAWRHSKWLTFMEKRLKLAQRLLKPDTGVLIVTIDEHEVHHLGMLLEQLFPNMYRQMVTIVTTPGGVTQGRFSRVEEYALFCFNSEAFTASSHDDLLSSENGKKVAAAQDVWQSLIRRGVGSQREDRPGMFFPISIDPTTRQILGAGSPLPLSKEPNWGPAVKRTIAWPVRSDGALGRWRVGPETFNSLLKRGYVKLGGYDEKRRTWTVLYLQRKAIAEIEDGTLQVISRDAVTNTVVLGHGVGSEQLKPIKTVWNRSTHHAGSHGSTLLRNIFGESSRFSYPKSIYATRDTLAAIVRDKPNALILDFFAGSGTTLNAVNLLNASDNGKRRCILVTNNEVSAEEAERLRVQGFGPGDPEWESAGICQSVTWPRSKFTIVGSRDDGTPLPGSYMTGRYLEAEMPRKFTQLGFVDSASLNKPASRKQLISLLNDLPQSLVEKAPFFVVSPKHTTSILFDIAKAEEWIAALEGQEHITDFYIVTSNKKLFDVTKTQVIEMLGPSLIKEEEKRPLASGFASNCVYLRMEFLDKDHVALNRAFRELLPLLWLKAGAVGSQPRLATGTPPEWFVPEANNFAVLLKETAFGSLRAVLKKRPKVGYVYVVTDANESFKDMQAELIEVLGTDDRAPEVIQLYRDYLLNFMINKASDSEGELMSTDRGVQNEAPTL